MDENITTIGIREASRILDCDRNYVLQLIKKGKLQAEKTENENGIPVWKLLKDEVTEYAANKGKHNTGHARADGRVKWIVYGTIAELDAFLAANPGATAVRPTYKKAAKGEPEAETDGEPKARKPRKARKIADTDIAA